MFEKEDRVNGIIKRLSNHYDLCFYKGELMSTIRFFNLIYLETNFYTGTLQAYQVEKKLTYYINNKEVIFKKASTYFGFPHCLDVLRKIYKKEDNQRSLNKFVG